MPYAKQAHGTTLARAGNVIAESIKIGGWAVNREMLDVTAHDSPDGYDQYIPGLKRSGEFPISGNFYAGDTNGQIGLLTDFEAGTLQDFVLTYSDDGTTLTFKAYVKEFGVGEADVNGSLPFTASLKINGKPVVGITNSAGITTPFMTFSAGTCAPAPATAVLDYVLTEANGVSTVTITPTAAAGVITITANGVSQVVTSGQASTAIALGAAGSITVVSMSVKETGKTAKVYTIRVVRAA